MEVGLVQFNTGWEHVLSLANHSGVCVLQLNCTKTHNINELCNSVSPCELKDKLEHLNARLYGITIKCSFKKSEIIQNKNVDLEANELLYAKKSIDLLRALGGSLLEIVVDEASRSMLDAIARYASSSAAGGNYKQNTIKIAYRCNEPRSLEDIISVHSKLQSKAVGLSLYIDENSNEYVKDLIKQANMCEFAVNHIVIDPNVNESFLRNILHEVAEAYDGVLGIRVFPDTERMKIIKARELARQFDSRNYDYTKMSYPSSVARRLTCSGKARISPADNITAGTIGTWEYTYTVGENGIKQGGGIKLRFHHSTNWRLQISEPSKLNYTSVHVSNKDAETQVSIINEDACQVLKICISDGELQYGDEIRVVIGDRNFGARGAMAQTYEQKDFTFFTSVDENGYGYYCELRNPPKVTIIGGEATQIKVLAPSIVGVGEEFSFGICVQDRYGNIAHNYSGDIRLNLDLDVEMTNPLENNALIRVNKAKFFDEGLYYIKVHDGRSGLKGVSNAIKCVSNPEHKVYWGDIHGHCGLMDATGSVDDYYEYARDTSFLDFCSLSEHMDTFTGGRQASNDIQWEEMKRGVKQYNSPGKFVTILGYENSVSWDANVYFSTDDAPWYATVEPTELFRFAKEQNAIVIPHMTTYPKNLRGYDWIYYDPEVIPVMEIYSSHGASEYFGGERPLLDCEPGGYAHDALKRGCKVGFIGSGDGHDCKPGNSMWAKYENGLVAVFAKELTRQAIIDAIKNRRCYATTNERILVIFSINDHIMGEEFSINREQARNIKVNVYGTDEIMELRIIRNGESMYSIQECGKSVEFCYDDDSVLEKETYYYVKVCQKSGGIAWSSPIWVTPL